MGKSRINRWWSPSELETEIRSGTWAKRFYLWRLLSSCRAPSNRLSHSFLYPSNHPPIMYRRTLTFDGTDCVQPLSGCDVIFPSLISIPFRSRSRSRSSIDKSVCSHIAYIKLAVDEDRQPTKQSPDDNTGGRTNTSASRYNHNTSFVL